MTLSFQLTNSHQAGSTALTTRSYRGVAKSETLGVVHSSDNDHNDAAIIAAGITRIGDRPLKSLKTLDAFLAELDSEEDSA